MITSLSMKAVEAMNLSGAAGAINTAAYTEVKAATANPASGIQILNTTGSLVKIAVGAAAAEQDVPFFVPSGAVPFQVRFDIRKGARISARAIDTNSTGGQLVVNLLG